MVMLWYCFTSLPYEDTGVFHVLEHSVLCGSEKYPVNDPFVELVKSSLKTFLIALTYEELEGLCSDEGLLEAVAKAGNIRREIDDLPFEPEIVLAQPVRKGPGFFATLLGLASNSGSRRTHPGRCTGDCANCPAHYGYCYGRWYYGHHHSHGCEFGGNDCSGKP